MMKLIDDIGFDNSFSFIFSTRPGTPAANLRGRHAARSQADAPAAPAGGDRRQHAQDQRGDGRHGAAHPGRGTVEERPGELQGRTENNRVVNFAAGADAARLIGQLIDVASPAGVFVLAARRTGRPSVTTDTIAEASLKTKLRSQPLHFIPEPLDNTRLAHLCGPLDENLRQISAALDVTIFRRGEKFIVSGANAERAVELLEQLLRGAPTRSVPIEDVQLALVEQRAGLQAHGRSAAGGRRRAAGDSLRRDRQRRC